MYKVTLKKEYTRLVFKFKEFIDASCFIKSTLDFGESDFEITVEFEPEGICAEEGEE